MLIQKNARLHRWWDSWLAVLILATVSLVGVRLWATDWTGDLYLLVYLAFIAGAAGLMVGFSRFSVWITGLFAAIFGTFTFGWLFGTTLDGGLSWRVRILNILGWRLRIAIEQVADGNTITDPILFLTVMAAMLWITGFVAAFILIRKGSVWPSLIPLGVSMLVIGHYDLNPVRNTRYILTFFLLALLILGRLTYMRYQQKWQQEGITTTSETRADFNKTLLVITLILIVLAWVIPVTPAQASRYSDFWETLTEPWDQLTDELSRIFVVDQTDPTYFGFFGDSLNLGSGTPASEEVVFTVEVTQPPPPGYRNYWRARTYDTYQGATWSSSPGLAETMLFPEEFLIPYPAWEGGETAAYTITTSADRTANYLSPGLPTWLDRPAQAILHPLGENEQDLISLIADPALFSGDAYQVETQVRLPTEAELLETTTEYPGWTERYLQLPDDFSEQIAALAVEITQDVEHPYEKASAITRYLRINIDYARTIPAPPTGADPIEWFLFEQQMGFCNYYATAEVLMLRTLGIPARMAVGYAQGDLDPESGQYAVRKRDSHAWVEVYFNDYGWVVFEPTVSQPAYILPAGFRDDNEQDFARGDDDIPQMNDPTPQPDIPLMDGDSSSLEGQAENPFIPVITSRIIWTILAIFGAALLALVFILLRPMDFDIKIDPLPVLVENYLISRAKPVPEWLHHWSLRAQMSAPERAYRRLSWSIKLIGLPLKASDTPIERAHALIHILPDAEQPALDIVNEYQLEQYSNHIINEERAKAAGRQVRKLAMHARLRQIFSFGNKPKSINY